MTGVVSGKLKDELLSLSKNDLTVSNIIKFFSTTTKKESGKFITIPPKFKTTDSLHLNAGEFTNITEVDTSVGIYLFNKLLLADRFEKIIPNGYFNEIMDKKKISKLVQIISDAINKRQIEINPTVVEFLKDYEFYGLKLSSIFNPSYSMNMIMPNKELMEEKAKKIKQTSVNNVQDMARLEDDLVKDAKRVLDKDPAMTLFKSGARGSFENDYKNMSLMVGPVPNPVTGKFDFVATNYTQGLSKKDIPAAGNIVVTSSYPKAVGTAVGGQMTKLFYAVYQSIVVDDPGTDCGTKECLEVFLTNNNLDLFLFQNIKLPSGKLITLTDENANEFLNKKVSIRSPMFCLTDKICSKCAGIRFEVLDIKNVGLTSGRISNGLMNLRMKAKHSTKVSFNEVNVDNLLL